MRFQCTHCGQYVVAETRRHAKNLLLFKCRDHHPIVLNVDGHAAQTVLEGWQ